MRYFLSFVIISLIALTSCDNPSSSNNIDANAGEGVVARNNYVVVWDILTDDYEYVMTYLPKQAEEFDRMFKEKTIENAYLNKFEDVEVDKNAALATIVFILNATSMDAAEALMDQMVFVRNKVASYKIHSIGPNRLGRQATADENAVSSFAVIWSNLFEERPDKYLVDKQTMEIMDLWKKGVIENAYYPTADAFEQEDAIPGMLFFVNANTEEEARAICDNLVYSKKGIANYTIHSVGTFWQGTGK